MGIKKKLLTIYQGVHITYFTNTILVALVGGQNSSEGNVHAYNPTTNLFGPVCDDIWNIVNVSI